MQDEMSAVELDDLIMVHQRVNKLAREKQPNA